VAGVAGDEAGLGQARIEIELAQFDQGRVGDLGWLDRLDRFLAGGMDGLSGQAAGQYDECY
jgi:predicted methyltransferase MtxX (methanogen marker protein 4)